MYFISLIILLYFLLATLYVLVLAIAGKLNYGANIKASNTKAKVAIFVPAYKEDNIIISVANKLLQCNYSEELFDIIIIADSFKKETIIALNKLPIKVVEVSWQESTKAKSLNFALNLFDGSYDIAIISDADNILEIDFINKINDAYQSGYHVIQGRRIAKNLNTSFAILDASSEAINNHLFRKGANALGLSSALIGSGMAFNFQLLKNELSNIDAVGGFDKELQLNLIEAGYKILYLEDAIVYDEKVDKPSTFGRQRRRWISTQFIYLKSHFHKGLRAMIQGNFSYFNLSILTNVFLSRILTLGALFGISILYSIIKGPFNLQWWLLFVTYSFVLFISLPKKMFNKNTLLALLSLPNAFIIMLISFLRIKGANKTFIHTKHTNVEIENPVL